MKHQVTFVPSVSGMPRDHVLKDGVHVALILRCVHGWYLYGAGFDPKTMYRTLHAAQDAARMILQES